MMIRKNIIVFTIILIILITTGILLISNGSGLNNSYIETLVTPVGSAVKIDGHGVTSGKHNLKPGNHVVTASKNGFVTQQQTIILKNNEARFAGFVLVSSSPNTVNWYKQHPTDQSLGESIASRNFDQTSKDATVANPLLKKLPYIGPGFSFRIDYGVPSSKTKINQTGIYVRYETELGKQAALQWIKNQNVDPSTLDIIYIQGSF